MAKPVGSARKGSNDPTQTVMQYLRWNPDFCS